MCLTGVLRIYWFVQQSDEYCLLLLTADPKQWLQLFQIFPTAFSNPILSSCVHEDPQSLRRRLNLTWPTGQNVASFVKTCQATQPTWQTYDCKTVNPIVNLRMSSGFTLKSYLWCWKLRRHQVIPPLLFTRPLLQKGSSLQEEILCVCLFVRHHFFLLRIFNNLMI